MERRGFLRLLAAGLVGHTLDVDKLLWVPGAKTFFIPSGVKRLTSAEIITAEMERLRPRIQSLFDNDSLFYARISKRGPEVISSREFRIPLKVRGDK
jgi:hypothetical protein